MRIESFRRYYLDNDLINHKFVQGHILDLGGKKENKRGKFRHPENIKWSYLNIDKSVDPDFCCSSDAIPVEDNHFDGILSCELFEHLEDPIPTFHEIYRVLRPGGEFIGSMPFLYPFHADPYDYNRFTNEKLKLEFQKIGFKNVEIKSQGGTIAVLCDIFRSGIYNNKLLFKIYIKLFNLFFPILCYLDKNILKSKNVTSGWFIKASK